LKGVPGDTDTPISIEKQLYHCDIPHHPQKTNRYSLQKTVNPGIEINITTKNFFFFLTTSKIL